jgi:sugar phosphate isomerase/epimerase
MTVVELGVNSCFAVKRWPLPGDWARIVRDDLGLSLVQHSLDLVDLDVAGPAAADQADAVRDAVRDNGLTLHSTFTGLTAYSSNLLLHPDAAARERAERWWERAVDVTAAMGAAATGGHVGAFSVPDWRDPGRRSFLEGELRAALDRLAGYASARGLRELYVENLAVAREPSTMASIDELLTHGDERHVPVRLCLDVGHQVVVGSSGADRDPYAWLRRYGTRAGLVQLQQSDDVADHHWPFTAATNALGRIEADRVLAALVESGASRVALVLEVIPPFEADDDEVVRDLVASAAYWRDAISAAGMRS